MQRMEANILKLLLVNDRISQTDTNRKPQALGKLVNRHYPQQRQDGGVFLAASAGVRSPDHPPLNAKENKRTKKSNKKQKQMTKTLNTLTNIIYVSGFIAVFTFTINAIINQ